MQNDWLFSTDEYICELRTVAVLVKDNKILVQKDRNGNEYALPGGHVKIGETLENGLIREIMEEIGVKIKCNRLLWSEECFWEWNEKQVHNIAFYYLIELIFIGGENLIYRPTCEKHKWRTDCRNNHTHRCRIRKVARVRFDDFDDIKHNRERLAVRSPFRDEFYLHKESKYNRRTHHIECSKR